MRVTVFTRPTRLCCIFVYSVIESLQGFCLSSVYSGIASYLVFSYLVRSVLLSPIRFRSIWCLTNWPSKFKYQWACDSLSFQCNRSIQPILGSAINVITILLVYLYLLIPLLIPNAFVGDNSIGWRIGLVVTRLCLMVTPEVVSLFL